MVYEKRHLTSLPPVHSVRIRNEFHVVLDLSKFFSLFRCILLCYGSYGVYGMSKSSKSLQTLEVSEIPGRKLGNRSKNKNTGKLFAVGADV